MELKESDDMYIASFTRGFIFEQWLPTSGSDIERRRQVVQYLIQMVPNAENVDTSNLNNVVTYICNRILVFWKSSGRNTTGIQQSLIERCGTILECISSGYKINVQKFQEYAVESAEQLLNAYKWYPLPASVHKVLLHGAIIIENALVPIGELSEEAAESNNKNIKFFRRNHTRKMSRDVTNSDLIHRLLLNSDPVISSSRRLPRKKNQHSP
ncbi:uncharacterized protein LOC133517389 [Cydia pomonella]|uniref:uncharacterized protein LOC133517389 n=1 Tax=Cydia pomonella TaxID=82600 RepID=UPI002ADD4519|nr:uncharacterized protein LOC133517389 [Cydia pomonella]